MPEGFLVEVVHQLPQKYSAWDDLAKKLPDLNKNRLLKEAVNDLPLIEIDDDELTEGEWRRCYVIFSFLIQSYVNNSLVPWDLIGGAPGTIGEVTERPTVPKSLAIPYSKVCHRVGLPMVLTASGADLWNMTSSPGPTQDLQITATTSETGFHTVPYLMHKRAAPYLSNLFKTAESLTMKHLTDLIPLFNYFKKTMAEETIRLVDPSVFYNVYRPLLTGFFPDAVLFEGVGEISAKGPSAGQSAMFFIFDSLLGVNHNTTTRDFQQEMMSFIPREQRVVVEKLQSIFKNNNLKSLFHSTPAYAQAVTAYTEFRKSHFSIASFYLKAASKGTGNSSFRTLLSDAIDGTKNAKL